MRTISATDAAFAGFKLIRSNPAIVLMWTLVSFLFALGLIVMLGLFVGGPIMSLAQLRSGAEPSPEQIASLVLTLLPAILLMIPLALIFNGVMVAGVNRAILRPKEKGFFYLRLGGDEMRLALVLLIQGLATFAIDMAGQMLQFAVVGGGSLAAGAMENDTAMGGMFFVGLLLRFVSIGVLIFLSVRFCLAAPQSFATKSINIIGTWSLTKGRFWTIVGAYLLSGVIVAVIILLVGGVAVAIGVGAFMAAGLANMTGEAALMQNLPTIVGFVAAAAVVYGLLITFANTVIYAVAPNLYQQIVGADDPSAVFS